MPSRSIGTKGLSRHDGRVDVAMTELEVRAEARRAVPDHAARPHHGMSVFMPTKVRATGTPTSFSRREKTVDHLFQRQVAQARVGQPVGESSQLHHDELTVPLQTLRIKVA